MPESPRSSNRNLQSKTRGLRNSLHWAVCVTKSPVKVKMPIPSQPCRLPYRSKCREVAQWSEEGTRAGSLGQCGGLRVIQSRMGRGREAFPENPAGSMAELSVVGAQFCTSSGQRQAASAFCSFDFSGCFPIKVCPSRKCLSHLLHNHSLPRQSHLGSVDCLPLCQGWLFMWPFPSPNPSLCQLCPQPPGQRRALLWAPPHEFLGRIPR